MKHLKDKDFIKLEKIVDDMISIINNCIYPKPTSAKGAVPISAIKISGNGVAP